MQMAKVKNGASSTLIARLNAEMNSRGINQDALAALLGISQGHLSKILSGKTPAGRRTVARARDLLDGNFRVASASDGWLAIVGETARGSSAFRAVVDAALKLTDAQSNRRKRRGG
jgi:transcriptional regulator with XRE-family HTH domain